MNYDHPSINHPSVTEKLAEAARNNYDDIVKAEVALTLARKSNFKDERAIPGLEIALTTHSSNAQKAIKALKQINTESAVEALVRALELPDSQLRIRKHIIIQAISEMNREPTLLVLRRIVRRTKIGDHVNAHVLQTLAQLRDQEIVPDLIERIRVHDATKYNTQVIKALGELGNPVAIEPILGVLNDNDLRVNRNQRQIVEAAITTLGKIGGEKALQALQQLQRTRVWSRYGTLLYETIRGLERRLQNMN